MKLKYFFMGAFASPKFAWNPNPSDPKIPLDSLFPMYIHIGAKIISQAIEKVDIYVSNNIGLQKILAGKGMVKIRPSGVKGLGGLTESVTPHFIWVSSNAYGKN